MRKEAGLITLFTSAAGAIGLFIRWIQISSIFEPETGLPIRGAASSVAMVATLLIYSAALIVIVQSLRKYEKTLEYRGALRGNSIFYPLAAFLLGAVTVAAAIMIFAGAAQEERPGLWRMLAVAAVLCGASYPLLTLGPRRNGGNVLTCFAAVLPTILFCVWLVVCYMINSANPVIWAFSIEVLAISGAVLGFYYCAGYAFGKARPLSTAYFTNIGAFLCIVTLADNHSIAVKIIFGAAAAMLLMLSSTLVGNFVRPSHKPING